MDNKNSFQLYFLSISHFSNAMFVRIIFWSFQTTKKLVDTKDEGGGGKGLRVLAPKNRMATKDEGGGGRGLRVLDPKNRVATKEEGGGR